ncbi:MAG: hypothetical protein A2087_10725 [Spirochaetes bacterium GWD1_61_31]|nr:MAG: hypothetical protein A2Y37_09600 [Spirochaetes bacterium GWB1_60_80]OHD31141.1 MAG: hypothetical protein A2004_11605 [Spirochaetes bacterium GWC1_61_12]OHD35241.1 MAG: hypothetical protein A2087_10725 [Spirochaetes bacterium GWD1_61_31]OHD41461.1 MAG: hypothetical protein A2Y35_05905 [Spirochaetes bacterium GWE1_60_18]OHD61363.1 MAG: hypothetical protein A2Y32_04295 [Spirochaetes bacterium GWF1_60_12]HAP43362.1 flagellar biosynthesis protein FlhB [Spirochaetaceae bacterium]
MSRYKRVRARAVGIRYERGGYAPWVVARADGAAAGRLVRLAGERGVPVLRDRTLAESLCLLDPGAFVPAEYWEIVARILLAVKDIKL